MSNVGFCLLTNVAGYDEKNLFSAVKAYHELPLEEKIKMAPRHHNEKNENIFHGYFPFIKNDSSHKEFFDMGRSIDDIS
jgi:isopenicillin N synthase-like dioxygenase